MLKGWYKFPFLLNTEYAPEYTMDFLACFGWLLLQCFVIQNRVEGLYVLTHMGDKPNMQNTQDIQIIQMLYMYMIIYIIHIITEWYTYLHGVHSSCKYNGICVVVSIISLPWSSAGLQEEFVSVFKSELKLTTFDPPFGLILQFHPINNAR